VRFPVEYLLVLGVKKYRMRMKALVPESLAETFVD
jgi:hypothetical protein